MLHDGVGAFCALQLPATSPGLRVLLLVAQVIGLLVLLVGIPVCSFLFWMGRDLKAEEPEEADGLEQESKAVLHKAGEILNIFYCYCLIYFWLVRYRVRNRIARYITIVFLAAGAIGIVEKLLQFLERYLQVGALKGFFLQHARVEWFISHTERFLANWITILILLIIEYYLIRHHLREPAHHHMERTTLSVLKKVLTPLSQLNTDLSLAGADPANPMSEDTRDKLTENYYSILSLAMVTLFKERQIDDLNICIMKFNKDTGFLEIKFENDKPRKCDHTFKLKPGEGNAGRAYKKGNSFYVPAIRYKHALELVPQDDDSIRMKVRSRVYKPSQHPFKTMLSSPIRHKTLDIVGVVNLSSEKESAFRGSDFDIAGLVAVILGLMNH
jgi:hypothetical protein